jgi:hypothetical protein
MTVTRFLRLLVADELDLAKIVALLIALLESLHV